eukprot:tig00000841_g4727.t1
MLYANGDEYIGAFEPPPPRPSWAGLLEVFAKEKTCWERSVPPSTSEPQLSNLTDYDEDAANVACFEGWVGVGGWRPCGRHSWRRELELTTKLAIEANVDAEAE